MKTGGTSTTDVTMTNSDGYPDIILVICQYTSTLKGGLSGEKYGGMGKTTGTP